MKLSDRQYEILPLSEWETTVVEGHSMTDEDRRIAAQLCSGGNSRLVVDELRTGLRISARSWVGLIRFSTFEVHIVPKLVGDNLGLVELIDYAAGLDSLGRHPAVRTLEGKGLNLFDIIALLLAEGCEQVIRSGILSDYCEVEDDIPVVRGRLMTRQQVLKRYGRIDRLECRYDEYITDIPENRILLAGLRACFSRVRHPVVSMHIRRLLAIFSEACCLEEVYPRKIQSTLIYNRMNEHYRESHELAWLILDGLGIEDIYTTGSHRCFTFLLDMNKLFENFITRWIGQLFSGDTFRVIPQRRDRSIVWNVAQGRPYKSIIPDLLIEQRHKPGRYLPIDAKYKLYDEHSVASSDIYQAFLYAYAYGEHQSTLPSALILYPASTVTSATMRLNIRRSGGSLSAQLRLLSIHIPTALDEARNKRIGSTSKACKDMVEASLM